MRKKKFFSGIFFITVLLMPPFWGSVCRAGHVPYNSKPDLIFGAEGQSSTGLVFADINGDGWKDAVVANGNDMARQRVVVFYNKGDGTFPSLPDWRSADISYNGNLAVGDINKDGWLDVAVGIFTGDSHTYIGGGAKVYMNKGKPSFLEKKPSWSVSGYPCFVTALGDANGDGFLDLAVAAGNAITEVETFAAQHGCKEGYTRKNKPYVTPMPPPFKQRGYIYYNNKKTGFDTVPGWRTDRDLVSYDVEFADVNNDHFIDIIFAATHPVIYFANEESVMAPSAGWRSTKPGYFAFSIDFAQTLDIDYTDSRARVSSLAVSTNNYMGGGEGRFQLFRFTSSYIIDYNPKNSNPSWVSPLGGWGSIIRLADVNGDGYVDLAAGRWAEPGSGVLGAPLEIYLGNGIRFEEKPSFRSKTFSVLETIAVADLRNRGLKKKTEIFEKFTGSVITLSHPTVEKLLRVSIAGKTLSAGDYIIVPGQNIIYLAAPREKEVTAAVSYYYSTSPDIGVVNWNCDLGNYIFYNKSAG